MALIFRMVGFDRSGWVKPIIVTGEDSLTTATKRAQLAHNEAWTEFCK